MLIRASCFDPRELYVFIIQEPLLAFFLMRSKIIEDEKLPFVAGVSVQHGQINLHLNPTRMSEFSSKEKIGILVHEYLHVLLLHCTERRSDDPEKHTKENIAKDMAINQMILRCKNYALPDWVISHDKEPFKFPANLTAEQYFELIDKNYTDEEIEKMYVAFDDHGAFGESSNGGAIEGKAIIKELAKAYAQTKHAGDLGDALKTAGNQYGNILEKLVAIETYDINWQVQAKRFLAKIVDSKRQFTFKRFSKRYGFPAQGEKFKTKTKVAAIVDTSGSMSASFLSHIGGQLNLMSKIMRVDVIMCDVAVQGHISKFKPSRELEFPGRGGTDMQPAFEYVQEEGYRGVICFTDGGLYSPVSSKLPTLWVSVNNRQFNPPFGSIVHVLWKD
jgi:predicted metal-dependent peptidase